MKLTVSELFPINKKDFSLRPLEVSAIFRKNINDKANCRPNNRK